MSDLEMTKLCAEAMGWTCEPTGDGRYRVLKDGAQFYIIAEYQGMVQRYDPLHDDAQAMALQKAMFISTGPVINTMHTGPTPWMASSVGEECCVCDESLNRAIVQCVASMRSKK